MTRPDGAGPMRVVILGAGAHGRAVADLLQEGSTLTLVGFSDADSSLSGQTVLGVPVLGDDVAALKAVRGGACDGALVGVGNTAMSARRALGVLIASAGIPSPMVAHPRATVAASASVGAGTVVFAGAVLGARVRCGANVVVYSGAIVEHDSILEDHAYLGPGAVLAGQVTVREGAFVGVGAVVLPGVEVGRDAVVAGGAVVTEAVAPGTTVAGVPARLLQRKGER
jgi:sugar O-acyltransferase (sialic acid O-acetyltransferase NeuD family)